MVSRRTRLVSCLASWNFPITLAVCSLALAFGTLFNPAQASDFFIERIARSGDPIPGREGAYWLAPAGNKIDDLGNVLFDSTWTEPDGEHWGLWYGDGECVQIVMEFPSDAIGFDDPDLQFITYSGQPNLAPDGTIALLIEIDDPENPSTNPIFALYTGKAGDLKLVMYSYGPAPDSSKGATLGSFEYAPLLNSQNQLGVINEVIMEEWDPTFRSSIFVGDSFEATKIVAQALEEVPGVPGASFMNGQVPSVGGFALNDLGWAAFTAWFEGPEPGEQTLGVFYGPPDDVQLVAKTGGQAPGLEEGTLFSWFLFENLFVDANENIAFVGWLDGPEIDDTNYLAVYAGRRDAIAPVPGFRAGEQSPGTSDGTVFWYFESLTEYNNRGELMVSAYLTGPQVTAENDEALWLGHPQDMHLLLREGEPAPGFTDGVLIDFYNEESDIFQPAIQRNNRGDMGLVVALKGEQVSEDDDAAIYYRSAGAEEFQLVVRQGEELDGQVVYGAGVNGSSISNSGPGARGNPRGINGNGQLAFYILYPGDETSATYLLSPVLPRDRKGDFDQDGDIDLLDFAAFQKCYASKTFECIEVFDFNLDSVVSLDDFEDFLDVATAPM